MEKELKYTITTNSQFLNTEYEVYILSMLFQNFDDVIDAVFLTSKDFTSVETRSLFSQILEARSKVNMTPLFNINDYKNYANKFFQMESSPIYLFEGFQKNLREQTLRRQIELNASQKKDTSELQEEITKLYSKVEAINSTAKEMESLWKLDGKIRGVSTGFNSLDKLILGLENGSLYTIGARSGLGKSSLMTSMMYNLLKEKIKIACFSFEMDSFEITTKIMSIHIKKSMMDIKQGFIPIESKQVIVKGMDTLDNNLNFNIYNSSEGKDINDLVRRTKALKREGLVEVIFVDYVGLMTDNSKNFGTRANELNSITSKLKGLAQDLSVPVVMLAQINRGVENRDNKRPLMSDLKDSGSIEQDSNVVMLLYRASYYLEQARGKNAEQEAERIRQLNDSINSVDLIIVKNRQGATKTLTMGLNTDCMEFIDINN